ncbi:MAG TPA: CYTH domain-containing protein [Chthoniobacterales bacterium]
MNVETERKFLVTNDTWRNTPSIERQQLRQGYLHSASHAGASTVRVRIGEQQAWLTIKGPTSGISRAEYEYLVPVDDAEKMLETLCSGRKIEKWRHRVPVDGMIFEVDEFCGDNEGLIVAEIELPSPNAVFPRPDWLGCEVTDDSRFHNSHLVRQPFQSWPKSEIAELGFRSH